MNEANDILTTSDAVTPSAAGIRSKDLLRRDSWDSRIGVLPWPKSEVKGKRVRLTHLDGKLPNLALMKLSAWLKKYGAVVTFSKSVNRELFEANYDLVLGSSIFKWSANARDLFHRNFPEAIIGGTGAEDSTSLEAYLGEDFPETDYSIYPEFEHSLGFTQRGCRLACSFCVVPKKEGRVRPYATLKEIWRGEGHPRNLVLLDNDFFGQSDWRARLQEALDGDFQICLNQGINVRLIHKEGAEMLSRCKFRDEKFKRKALYTAWDNRKDEAVFLKGINILLGAGIPPSCIVVYMLCGYWPGETWNDILHRYNTMVRLGLNPFPMVYDNKNKELKKFQRFSIQRSREIKNENECKELLAQWGVKREDPTQTRMDALLAP